MSDPCLSCYLPDCHDDHPDCLLRIAIKRRAWLYRRKIEIPPDVQKAATHAYNQLFAGSREKSHANAKARRQAMRQETSSPV